MKYIIVMGMKFYIMPVYTIFDLTVFQSNHGGFLSTMVAFVFCVDRFVCRRSNGAPATLGKKFKNPVFVCIDDE